MFWLLTFVLLAFWAGRQSVQLTRPPMSRLRGHIDATFRDAEDQMIAAWARRRQRRSDDDGRTGPTVIDQ